MNYLQCTGVSKKWFMLGCWESVLSIPKELPFVFGSDPKEKNCHLFGGRIQKNQLNSLSSWHFSYFTFLFFFVLSVHLWPMFLLRWSMGSQIAMRPEEWSHQVQMPTQDSLWWLSEFPRWTWTSTTRLATCANNQRLSWYHLGGSMSLLISVKRSPAWSESAQVRNILRLLGLVRLKGNDE